MNSTNCKTSPQTFLSIRQVAWLLGVSESRVCRAIRIGRLPCVRRRRCLVIPAHALAHLADTREEVSL
jgi:uncharacterized protein